MGKIIARGISRFSSNELQSIAGADNLSVMETLGLSSKPEVVHRDFLAPLISKASTSEIL